MPYDDNRGALEQLRRRLFGPPPATDAAPPPPPVAIAHNEGANPPAALTAEAVFRDWALRVIDANHYRALNPVALGDLADMLARD